MKVPGATQELLELSGNGASQRIFRRFIESSYFTLDPERTVVTLAEHSENQMPKRFEYWKIVNQSLISTSFLQFHSVKAFTGFEDWRG